MQGGSRYRADIDGLRAIAVALVIFYHLRPNLLPSGYLGVDIFFVISGYVVANSALAKVSGKPLSDIAAFWMRRIRRIVPPLILVVVAGALASAAVFPPYPPINYETIFRTGAASLFGLSNLYLERTATDYFLLDSAQLNPFLHTWSLGIEEQYYILFALFGIGLPSVLRLNARRSLFLIGLLLLIVGVSAGLAIASTMPALSKFYLPQTRIWEIGLGSLLAVTRLGARHDPRWPQARTALRMGLLVALVGMAFLPHDQGLYPTVSVFLACAASAGLVSLPPVQSARLEPLQTAPVVYIGLISYGLYLWHWVALFVLQATIGLASPLAVALAVGIPLALSAISYRFVETPFRDHRRIGDRRVLAAAAVALITALAVLGMIHQSPGRFYAGKSQDWEADWMPAADHAYAPDGKISKGACHLGGPAPTAIPDNCIARHQPGQPGRTILIVGDSHAFSDWAMLSAIYGDGWDWAAMSKDGCPLSLGDATCVAYWDAVRSYVDTLLGPGDVLYVSVNWHGSRSDKDYDTLQTLTEATAAKGAALVIKGPLPFLPRASYLCTEEGFRTDYSGCSLTRQAELDRIAPRVAGLKAFAKTRPSVHLFEPFDALCPTSTCLAFRDGKPLFRDSRHLAVWGSRSLTPIFRQVLNTVPPRLSESVARTGVAPAA